MDEMAKDGELFLRERAVRRLKKRRDFGAHLLMYTMVNAFLVAIWAMSDRHGFFWPVFPLAGWGIAVVMNAWDVYRSDEPTEEQISHEVDRIKSSA